MRHAKFGPDPLKTVAVHKEQRSRLTDRQTHAHTHTQIFGFINTRCAFTKIRYVSQIRVPFKHYATLTLVFTVNTGVN